MQPPLYFETHCHLNNRQFDPDRNEVIRRARQAGVRELAEIGYDLPSSRAASDLAEAEEDIYAVVGVHPHDADSWSSEVEAEIRDLAARPRTIAIGEIGLDFYRDLSPREDQHRAFQRQMELAGELDMPVVIHTRDSMPEALAVLEPYARAGLRGVLHCWSGTVEEAARAREMGFLLGIGGVVTYKNAGDLPEVVARSPLSTLLLETDCPYLSPVPHRGKRNEPAYVPLVAERVAALKGIPVEEVAAVTREAGRSLFRFASG
jgi:TatD DNase family protein